MLIDIEKAEKECIAYIKNTETENLKLQNKIAEFNKVICVNNEVIKSKQKLLESIQYIWGSINENCS